MSPKLKTILACLLLLSAGSLLWWTLRSTADHYDPQPFVGVGQIMADETAKVVNQRGQVVAIITTAHEERGSSLRIEWEAFRKELKTHPGINLVAVETLPTMSDEGITGCSSVALKELLERYAQVDALVFFMSLPDWRWLPSKVTLPPTITSKLIVRGDAPVSLKYHYTGYFERGFVSVLVSRRWGPAPDPITNPKTPREWFHNEYQIFTAHNYETLPE